MGITIVGLGTGDPGHLTVEAREALVAAGEVYLRTSEHPAAAAVPDGVVSHSFDEIYARGGGFSAIYEKIAHTVIELGSRPEGVIYAVPGHPLVGETSVGMILVRARQEGIPVRLVSGLSFLDASLVALRHDALEGLQISDAQSLAERHFPGLDPETPALVGQLFDRRLASDVKLTLSEQYPEEHRVVVLRALGTSQASVRELAIHELDRQHDLDDLTSLFVPPLPPPASVASLQEVVARLRSPDGCAWDRTQTPRSLRSHLLEEAYEVLEALEADDVERLQEELGDLLFHVIIQVQMAAEAGQFRMADVVAGIVEKLVRRHPHVFDGDGLDDPQEIVAQWERIKKAEREAHSGSEREPPERLPALVRAQRRARLSPDSESELIAGLRRVVGVLGEVQAPSDRERFLGEVLLQAAALADRWEIDAEGTLRETLTARNRGLPREASVDPSP